MPDTQLVFNFERVHRRSLPSPTGEKFSSVGEILKGMGYILYASSTSVQEECQEDFSEFREPDPQEESYA